MQQRTWKQNLENKNSEPQPSNTPTNKTEITERSTEQSESARKNHKSTNMQQNWQPNYNQQHAERNSRGIKQEENKHLERTGLTPQKAKKTPTEGPAPTEGLAA
jgi:hypothetical protein